MNKKVIVTTSWDDGHVCDLRLASLLTSYGIGGTFYISPESREVSLTDRLSRDQIKRLAHDFEIGAHTMTHPRLSQIDDATARKEIADSKTYLERVTGKSVMSFCYPGGDFTDRHVEMVREAGFTSARTVERFAMHAAHDPFRTPTTIHAYRHWSDALPIFKHGGPSTFLSYYTEWDKLAISLFEKVRAEGGVFHLWGHSWEIDKHSDWNRLERVLQHIKGHSDVEYAVNGALI